MRQKHIWRKLIDSTNLGEVNKMQLKNFVEEELPREGPRDLNGHQIKACFRAALALASRESNDGNEVVKLTEEQLRQVLELTQDFRSAVKVPATGLADGLFQIGAEIATEAE